MKYELKTLALALLTTSTLITGCKKDDDQAAPAPPPNEEEVITTLRLTFTSTGGGETTVFNFVDADGEGGNAPVITADTLSSDTLYSVAIEVLNESENPVEDITAEIVAEDEEHQFFFQVSGVNATISYADADGNLRPIGLLSNWAMGDPGAGTVLVTLRHEPDKGAPGVSAGDITNAGGETDIEVTFPLVVQ